VVHGRAGAVARHRVLDDLGDARMRAVAHQQDLVGQQDRLVDVVRDHEDGLPGLAQMRSSSSWIVPRVSASSAPKGSSSSSILGWIAKRAGDADPLLHAARQLGRLLVLGRAEADHSRKRLLCSRSSARPSRASASAPRTRCCFTVIQGSSAWPWKTTPRSSAGPETSRRP
jgi:hypothetical protein